MRLAGGNLDHEGRVEICFNHQFGTICDDHWDRLDAGVICNQLGYSRDGKCYMLLIADIHAHTYSNH